MSVKVIAASTAIGVILVLMIVAFSVMRVNRNCVSTRVGSSVDEALPPITTSGTVTDIDGNVYTSVKIGDQIWMAENLRTTRLNDKTAIPLVKEDSKWNRLSSPGYCWYDNTAENKGTYGALYNWYAVSTGNLAPKGWHIPSDAEWTTLEKYLTANGYNWDTAATGNKIGKSLAAKTDWNAWANKGAIGNEMTGNNSTGFSALPGGYRDIGGRFYNLKNYGIWWSATEYNSFFAWARCLYCRMENLYRTYDVKRLGFSIRCLKD